MRTLLFLIAASVAMAQTSEADRVAPPDPPKQDAVDKLLNLVGTVPASEAPHVERWSEFALWTVGPSPLLGEAAGAALGQAANAPEEWGQGWGAFGKRFASNMAYNAVRQTVGFVGSRTLREDTRYFASRKTGFWPRTRHAVASTFMARGMDGSYRFSVSNTAGVVAAASAQAVWGPDSWKGPGNIATSAGMSYASTALFNIVREFLPDLFGRPRK